MKQIYVKPVTELISSHLEHMIAASPLSTNRFHGGQMKWDQTGTSADKMEDPSQALGIKNAYAGSIFSHGQSTTKSGSRAKLWDDWD